MIYSIIIILVSFFVSGYTGQASNFVVPITFYLLGQVLIFTLSDAKNKEVYARLYNIAYMVFLIYAGSCYIYMREHNYECLLVTDTIYSYIPAVKDFMRLGSWENGWELLNGSNSSQKYSHAGIILFYWAAVGKFGMIFGNELYFNLQVSILFLSAFAPIFLYRLLSLNGIKNPYNYSLIYALFSVFFYYSSLILRDAPIALFYMIAFSYLQSNKKVKKYVVFVLIFLLTFFIRPQNGFFLLIFYFISFISNSKRNYTSIILLTILAVVLSYISIRLNVMEAIEHNIEYAEKNIQQESEGVINALDRLPPVLSEIIKMMYIHLSPMPAWHYLGLRGFSQTNNIMGFPRMIAVVYNYIILGGIIYGIANYKRFKFTTKQRLLFMATMLYLLLQTSSTEQRRLMICYPMIFYFFMLIYQRVSKKQRKKIIQYSLLFFTFIQLIALIKG